MIYENTWLSLVAFFLLLMESLVGGAFLEEFPPYKGSDLRVYSLTPFPVVEVLPY